ncbi:MAG: FAD binding domain-containing protein [Pseudomonadota bacterium]
MARYHTPGSLSEACAVLAESPAVIAAGCTDLFPATEARTLPGPVLDLADIDELRGIGVSDQEIRIGALTSWSEIRHADLPPAFDMLRAAAAEVGGVQIQNAGTIGGNLCNASPAADGVPPLLALDAEVSLCSSRGARRMALSDFLTGPRQTARAGDEILTEIRLPRRDGASRFLKLGARHSLVISIVMVAARLVCDSGRIREAALAVGACSAVAVRLPALEAALTGAPSDRAVDLVEADLVTRQLAPIDDIRADAPYRVEAAVELIRRAVADLTGEAGA